MAAPADWARNYARRMFEQAHREGKADRINRYVGGRWCGRLKATQDDVVRARLAGQTVWVRKVVDGRNLIETQAGVLLDRPVLPGADSTTRRMAGIAKPIVVHIPRSVVASWPAESRVLGVVDEPARKRGGPLWEAAEEFARRGEQVAKDWEKPCGTYTYANRSATFTDPLARPTIAEMDAVIDRLTGRYRKGRTT